MDTTPGRAGKVAIASIALVVTLSVPGPASAQITLVVRDEASADEPVASAVDDALRDATGTSARRVEPTLDDLALAAGCAGAPAEAECVAAIASAAGARLVAIEHVDLLPTGARIRLDLRRGDGTRLRTIVAECTPESCADAMHVAMERGPAETLASAPEADPILDAEEERVVRERTRARASVAPAVVPSPVEGEAPGPSRDPRAHARWNPPLARLLLFGGASLASVGATVAAAVGIDYARQAADLGDPERRGEIERLADLEGHRDASFAVATAFGIVGAGLAIAGLVVPTEHREPRVEPVPVAGGAALVVRGAF